MRFDPDEIDWDDPPEFTICAGEGALGFELAAKQQRFFAIDRDQDESEVNQPDE